jgi:glucose/mannose transport system substrate-binding protein
MMISPPVQVAFNLKKGSLPIRADVDLAAANDCMKIGLKLLEDPANLLPSQAQVADRDYINQVRDLFNEFFTNKDMTVDDVQAQLVEIAEAAPK